MRASYILFVLVALVAAGLVNGRPEEQADGDVAPPQVGEAKSTDGRTPATPRDPGRISDERRKQLIAESRRKHKIKKERQAALHKQEIDGLGQDSRRQANKKNNKHGKTVQLTPEQVQQKRDWKEKQAASAQAGEAMPNWEAHSLKERMRKAVPGKRRPVSGDKKKRRKKREAKPVV